MGLDIIVDSASNVGDAETYIIPAIADMGIEPDLIIISHSHSDHAGGLERLASEFPNANIGMLDAKIAKRYFDRSVVFSDEDILYNCIKILNLPGHTPDSLGLLDMRTNTLISCDCLQLCGIGRYGTGITDAQEYIQTLNSLLNMGIDNIIASHDYVPLGYIALESENAERYIKECMSYALRLQAFVRESSTADAKAIARRYNFANPALPPVPESTIKALCVTA